MPNDTPSWLDGNPLIITGSWDTTPIFRIRRGVDSPHFQAEYGQRYTSDTVAAMQKLGVTLAVVDFMKCFGLAAELEIAEGLRPFIAECKQAGIRIGFYVGSTLCYETILLERPEAEDWLVHNPLGGFLDYVDPPEVQSFRARVYFPHPGYRAYIQEVLRSAIVDFQADEIHFDSASVMAEEPVFYHPRGIADFRRFLDQRYTPDELKGRLGFSSAAAVLPPRSENDTVPIHDPLVQEWLDFRCQMLVDYFAGMKQFIRGLNPEVAISVNTVGGLSLTNLEAGGVDHSRLLPLVDVLWDEEQDVASLPAGVLVSRIRSYKMVRGAGKRMLTYTGGNGQTKLQLAEAMAYNRETLGMVGDPFNSLAFPADQLPYVEFFRRNFDCYRGVETVADVAVLHSFRSMAYNSFLPRQSSLLFQQTLIQAKIPFDIVFDDRLQDLSAYRVLVLADQECLEEPQLTQIRNFVQAGGGLVATEFTSLYNNRRQRLTNFGLADLFGELPVPASIEGRDFPLEIPPVRREVGSGRVVYIPSVIAAEDIFTPTLHHYPLPVNWPDLRDAAGWAARGIFSLEVDAPLSVTAEVTRDSAGDRYFVHLLNYAPISPITAIGVRLRLPAGRDVASVEMLTTDKADAETLPVFVDGDVVEWAVPTLDVYAVLRVTLA